MRLILTRLLALLAVLVLVHGASAQVNSKLPTGASWNLEELQKLGKIVETRNEAGTKNRVVWVLEMKEVPKKLGLDVAFYDDEKGRLFTQKELECKVVKATENNQVKRVEVILKLPSENIQKNTAFVKFRKVVDE